MEFPEKVLKKMLDVTVRGGYLIYNIFTPNDCAYGEGERIDDNTFSFKNTLFKFYTFEESKKIIPVGTEIVKAEVIAWNDPPHGDFRPYPHRHEATFFILKKC